MHLTFLTPVGGLLALGALLPLGALALNERRAARARRALGVDGPPPKGFADTATTFAALDTFAGSNFFDEGIAHRLVILFTDAESAPYFGGDLHEALRPKPRTRFVIVRVGRPDERIYLNGKVDRGYRPDPAAPQAARRLASVLDGRSVAEGDLGTALAASRHFLGTGPV